MWEEFSAVYKATFSIEAIAVFVGAIYFCTSYSFSGLNNFPHCLHYVVEDSISVWAQSVCHCIYLWDLM